MDRAVVVAVDDAHGEVCGDPGEEPHGGVDANPSIVGRQECQRRGSDGRSEFKALEAVTEKPGKGSGEWVVAKDVDQAVHRGHQHERCVSALSGDVECDAGSQASSHQNDGGVVGGNGIEDRKRVTVDEVLAGPAFRSAEATVVRCHDVPALGIGGQVRGPGRVLTAASEVQDGADGSAVAVGGRSDLKARPGWCREVRVVEVIGVGGWA